MSLPEILIKTQSLSAGKRKLFPPKSSRKTCRSFLYRRRGSSFVDPKEHCAFARPLFVSSARLRRQPDGPKNMIFGLGKDLDPVSVITSGHFGTPDCDL